MEATLLAGIAAAAAAINSGLVIWNFLQSPSSKNAAALKALNEEFVAAKEKIAKLESAVETMPTKDAFHDLQVQFERMGGDLRVMGADLKAVKETSNLMRDWLLEKGVK